MYSNIEYFLLIVRKWPISYNLHKNILIYFIVILFLKISDIRVLLLTVSSRQQKYVLRRLIVTANAQLFVSITHIYDCRTIIMCVYDIFGSVFLARILKGDNDMAILIRQFKGSSKSVFLVFCIVLIEVLRNQRITHLYFIIIITIVRANKSSDKNGQDHYNKYQYCVDKF